MKNVEKYALVIAVIAIVISACSFYYAFNQSSTTLMTLSELSDEMKRLSSEVNELKGVTPPPLMGKIIKVGVLSAFTGAFATAGITIRRAVEMALEEVNSGGGVLGATVTVVFEDHGGDPKVAASAAEKLITVDNVHIIIAGVISSCAMSASEVTERYGVPYITDCSAEDLTARGYKYIFQTAMNSTEGALNSINFIRDILEPRFSPTLRIVVAHEQSLMGQLLANKFVSNVQKLGYKWNILSVNPYDSSALDFKPMLKTIMAQNPDIFVLYCYTTDATLIAKQMKELNWKPCVVAGGGGPQSTEFLPMAGKDVLYWFAGAEYYFDRNYPNRTLSREMFQKFYSKYKLLFETKAYQAYLAINLIKYAIEDCASLVPAKIAESLSKIDVVVPWFGRVRFQKSGHRDALALQTLAMVQVQEATQDDLWQANDVAWHTVYPANMKVYDIIFP